jgi:uncharacterized alpha-E superfamily protein
MMLARHAENLFWAGRYVERAQDTARMLDATYHHSAGLAPEHAARAWTNLLRSLGLDQEFGATGDELDVTTVTTFLIGSAAKPGAIGQSVRRARENARSVRELLSSELFEAFNLAYLELRASQRRSLRPGTFDEAPADLYAAVRRRCQSILGVASETMPRDDPWRFLMLGMLLERAEMVSRLLTVHLAADADDPAPDSLASWAELLESCAALEAFVRWQRGTTPQLTDVTAFLLLSRTFPRSVLRSLQSAEDQLSRLESDAGRSVCRRLLGGVRSELEFQDGHQLTPVNLTELLGRVRNRLPAVNGALADRFFSPGETAGLYLHELRGGDAAARDEP